MRIKKHSERGKTVTDWLDSYHSFSFNNYYDPNSVNFRSLRVINEDYVERSKGFPTHPHQNMEIITYIISGSLAHKDSMGNGSIINAGEIQRMSAGTGITHSEYNASTTELVHLLQIWILPEKKGIPPGYEQKIINSTSNQWQLIAAKEPSDQAVTIHQDAKLFLSKLEKGCFLEYKIEPARYVWVQIAQGEVFLNNHLLQAGDGAAIDKETVLVFSANQPSEILLFDLA